MTVVYTIAKGAKAERSGGIPALKIPRNIKYLGISGI